MVDVAPAPGFVGRAAEFDRLDAALARAAGGTPAIVVVGGEAGMGKTRLVEEFTRRVADGHARVLTGRCLRIGDGGLPFAPFVAAIRDLVRGVAPGEVAALLGPGRARLARLVPEVDGVAPTDAHGLDSRHQARAQLFEAVLDVVERVARRDPLILVIEDLQWADRSSLDLLSYLARVLREGRVLIVATVRSDEVAERHPLLEHLAELERMADVERIELAPFDRREVGELTAATLGGDVDPDVVDMLLQRTDGNPFYVDQLLLARRESGPRRASGASPEIDVRPTRDLPPHLRDILMARVAGLSEPAREVLRAAAAAGREVDDDLLAAVVDLAPSAIRDALREAVERRILVAEDVPGAGADEAGDPPVALVFRHELIREVVLAELFAGERQRLHAAFAAAIEARAAGEGRSGGRHEPAELAYHWDAAHDWPKALRASIEAGFAAEHAYAFAEALRHFERGLELWDRVDGADDLVLGDRATLLERTAEMASLSGEHRRAVELGRAAVAAVPPGVDEVRRILLMERLRWFLWEAGERTEAEAALGAAVRMTPDGPPTATRARLHAHRAALDMAAGRLDVSRDVAQTALREALAVGARAEEALALGVLGWDTALLGDVDAGLRRVEDARTIAADVDNIEGVALGWATLADLGSLVGRTERAVTDARAGVGDATRLGVLRTYGGRLRGTEAAALFDLGRWDEAEGAVAAGLDVRPTGRAEVQLLVIAARLDTGRGRFAAAARRLDAARAADGGPSAPDDRPGLLAAIAELAVWRGTPLDARPAVDEGTRTAERHEIEPALARLLAVAARADADLAVRARARHDGPAERDAIRAAATHVEHLAARSAAIGIRAPGLATRFDLSARLGTAELSRARGGADPGPWAGLATMLDDATRPVEAAYARFREAEALLAARGPRDTAAGALRSAHRIAIGVGADPLTAEVVTLARLARIELQTEAPQAGPHPALTGLGLTEREAEVLRLVAGGWTNQQIADALFIARKTASVHVSNILGKLGVDSRVEAAAIAHRLGFAADAPSPPDAT